MRRPQNDFTAIGQNRPIILGVWAITLACVAQMSVLIAGSATKAAARPAADLKRCAPLQLVTTAGTGESNPDDDPSDIIGLASGVNFTKNLTERYDNVTAWQTPYNASAGILSSNGETRAKYFLPYVASKQQAADAISEHLINEKVRCPDTKFVLTGYSQSAESVGDVLENINSGALAVSSADILGAYLLGDPKRSELSGAKHAAASPQAITNTGVAGVPTAAGAVLIPLDEGVPAPTTHGLVGSRAAGGYAQLAGKVRQLCDSSDKACAVLPHEPSARIGAYVVSQTEVDPDYYQAVSLKQMQSDGSFARAVGPYAGKLIVAMTYGDLHSVESLFADAAATPGLSDGQRASLRLTGKEMAGLMGAARIEIPARSATASSDLNRVIDVLNSISDQEHGLGKLGEIQAVPQAHGAYTGIKDKSATIGGVRADQWIQADMAKLLEANGAALAATEESPKPAQPAAN